ncbi:MAG: HNH endonuclease [Planctomycetota bacterium]|nr:HNH endonuclease [Planctomycetota bacterium]MDI6786854.1 HNH endonuclease [Planctomycetota bacterium]
MLFTIKALKLSRCDDECGFTDLRRNIMQADNDGHILNSSILALNKYYIALKVISARRAFVLLSKDNAEVVHKNNGRFAGYNLWDWVKESENNHLSSGEYVHTPTLKILVPRVIRLLKYDRMPRRELKFNRKNILCRDNYQCQYCGKKYSTSALTIDHVVPRYRGGVGEWTNLVTCCNKCNARKGGRLPNEADMKLIRNPQKPKFDREILKLMQNKQYTLWKEFINNIEDIS